MSGEVNRGNMSENLRESISALVDGETQELELRRILAADPSQVDESWRAFQRSSQQMNGELAEESAQFLDWDISARVSAAIADEVLDPVAAEPTAATASNVGVISRWLNPAAGFAVAASVALAVVVGLPGLSPSEQGGATGPAVAAVSSQSAASGSRVYPAGFSGPAVSGVATVASASSAQTGLPGSRAAADLAVKQQLEKYILRHTERAALNSGPGLISFARVASFEPEQP